MAWTTVATTAEVREGTAHVVEAGGHRIALCNTGEGVYAIADLCSHDDGPLDQGRLNGSQIECPRHGARFDVTTGKALCLPAVRPVKTYATRIDGDSIAVDVT